MVEKSFEIISKTVNKKDTKKNNGKLVIYIFILLFINIVLGVKNINIHKENINFNKDNRLINQNRPTKNIMAVKKLKDINNNIDLEELNTKCILVNEEDIEITIGIENKREYLDIVKALEKIYEIKSISPIIEEDKEKMIKVILC